jgi:maltooligosyltrehalose trehalohydrolase
MLCEWQCLLQSIAPFAKNKHLSRDVIEACFGPIEQITLENCIDVNHQGGTCLISDQDARQEGSQMTQSWSEALPAKLGAHTDGKMVDFLVWAPFADRLQVRLLDSDRYVSLDRDADGYHAGRTDLSSAGSRYFFRMNGSTERPDPASRCQPQGVNGPSLIVGSEFVWTDQKWRGIELVDYIFYELHMGTYTPEGTFDGLTRRLPELRELGITAIEIMPVAEFSGSKNWGYDGVYPFAAHHSYGGPLALKRLVDACHGAGLAVVLDVVYNHLGPEGNYLGEFGPYFTDRYSTPWGAAINFDGEYSDHVVRYFVENALQWLDEFHVDALRLDAIHGIVDRNAQPFLGCLAQAVADLAHAENRRIYLMAESDLNDFRVVQATSLGGYGLHAQWSDDFHHALHSLQTAERDGYYQDFGRVADLAKAYRSGFVFEGQYSAFRKQRHGNSAATVPAKAHVVCSQNHDQVGNRMLGERASVLMEFEALKLSATVVLLSPFLPLLFMGEEFCETNPFLYFTSHGDPTLAEAVRQSRRAEFAAFAFKGEPPDPQSESSFQSSKVHALEELTERQRALREFYRELIRLRRAVAGLRELNKETVETMATEEPKLLVVKRGSRERAICAMFNFEDQPVPFPTVLPPGRWRCLLDSADPRWFGPGSSVQSVVESPMLKMFRLAPHSACLFGRENA